MDEKIIMPTSQFLEEMEKFDEYPDTFHDYGLTREDIERIENNPKKYYRFAMYLLSRDIKPGHIFINDDALPVEEANFWLNEFIKNNISLID